MRVVFLSFTLVFILSTLSSCQAISPFTHRHLPSSKGQTLGDGSVRAPAEDAVAAEDAEAEEALWRLGEADDAAFMEEWASTAKAQLLDGVRGEAAQRLGASGAHVETLEAVQKAAVDDFWAEAEARFRRVRTVAVSEAETEALLLEVSADGKLGASLEGIKADAKKRLEEMLANSDAKGKEFVNAVGEGLCEGLYHGARGGADPDNAVQMVLSDMVRWLQDSVNAMIRAVARAFKNVINSAIPALLNKMCGFYNDMRSSLDFDIKTCNLFDCSRNVFCMEPMDGFKCRLRNLCLPVTWHTKFGIPYEVDRCISFDQTWHIRLSHYLPKCPKVKFSKNNVATRAVDKLASFMQTAFTTFAEISKWTAKITLLLESKFIGLSSLVHATIMSQCLQTHPPTGSKAYEAYVGSCQENLAVGQTRGKGAMRAMLVEVLTSKKLWKKVAKLIPFVDIIIDVIEDVTTWLTGGSCLLGLQRHPTEIIDHLGKIQNGFIQPPTISEIINTEIDEYKKRVK